MRFLILFFALIVPTSLSAHMPDRPDLNDWFSQLKSPGGGLCCSFQDGAVVEDDDVKFEDNHWKVFLNGTWLVVPDSAVLQVPNKYGAPLVWPQQYTDSAGKTQYYGVRCFLPGAGI